MGPRSQPGNSASRVVAGVSFGSVGPGSLSAAAGWRTFPGERHYRLSGGHKPVAKVDSLRWLLKRGWVLARRAAEEQVGLCSWPLLCVRLWWTVLSAPGLRVVEDRVSSG